jgi:hypothetical protein
VHSPGVLVFQAGRRRGSAAAVVVIVIVVRPRTEERLCKYNGDVQLDGSAMVMALWDMTPSRLAVSIIRVPMMEVASFSETSVHLHQTIRRHIPQDNNFQ